MNTDGMTAAVALRDSQQASLIQDAAAMAYWRSLGKRDTDVFLLSYPKSGRTWLRFMLTHYQLRLFDVDFQLTLRNSFQLSPNVTLFSPARLQPLPVGAPIHRIVGSHSEFPSLFRGLRLIVLRRDIRDVLVSYYRQRSALGEFHGDIESFLWSRWGLAHCVRYHNRWQRALERLPQDSVLKLTYEGLHSDPEDCVRACLAFIGVEIREDLIAETLAHGSAENMRKIEEEWGRTDFSVAQLKHDRSGFRVRKARVGSHRDELTPETVERVSATLRHRLFDVDGYDY